MRKYEFCLVKETYRHYQVEALNKLGSDGWYARHFYGDGSILMCRSVEAPKRRKDKASGDGNTRPAEGGTPLC